MVWHPKKILGTQFSLVEWWRPEKVRQNCRLGWQLCQTPNKTKNERLHSCQLNYIISYEILFIILDITIWSHPTTRQAATWPSWVLLNKNLVFVMVKLGRKEPLDVTKPCATDKGCYTFEPQLLIERPKIVYQLDFLQALTESHWRPINKSGVHFAQEHRMLFFSETPLIYSFQSRGGTSLGSGSKIRALL